MTGDRRALLRRLGLAVFALASCRGVAGFWATYHGDAIVSRDTDQGPWGGHRWLLWKADAGSFSTTEAAAFATRHGWECEAPSAVASSRLRDWSFAGQPVFPLVFDEGTNNDGVRDFPRRIQTDSWVIRCTTGWMRVQPGTDRTSPAYGFIHVSVDGREMAVYHLWGEV